MGKRPSIPEKIRSRLWVLAGGRCQYAGCNEPLWCDDLTMAEMNGAYIAHIVDVNSQTHRYDPVLSPQLVTDISNLMLLCDKHHRLIDHEEEREHTVKRLARMKQQHEDRIELLTSLQEGKKSHILLYGANVGGHAAHVSWRRAATAMIPAFYPAERQAIELSLDNSPFRDDESDYWRIERENLRRQFDKKVRDRLRAKDIEHLSVFAFAPIPLLMELGRLLSDIPAAEVYQLHREPPDWKWREHSEEFGYILQEPKAYKGTVALNLSLSATIEDSRITDVLGTDVSIWTLTIENPDTDFIMSRNQLSRFRQEFRRLLDRIKACHGQNAVLHVFPAAPVSVAVEVGRVWMPKADLSLCIYDQNRKLGGFAKALVISEDESGGLDDAFPKTRRIQ